MYEGKVAIKIRGNLVLLGKKKQPFIFCVRTFFDSLIAKELGFSIIFRKFFYWGLRLRLESDVLPKVF